jgi:cobalt/nickel transport system ATP-binding protein
MKNTSHIGVKDLVFSYTDSEKILNGLDLEVKKGEKVGLIGPNGSGKSTLFLLLAGVLKPDSGELAVLDTPVKFGKYNEDLGLVFQNPDDQLFCPTVRDDLAFGLYNLGYSRSEADSLIDAYLEHQNMTDLSERPPHNLSGGEKRMVSIAGVVIMNPSVVMLDEPESSLDSRARRQLIEFLRNSKETLLIASHDLEFLLETCERTVILDDGKICANGPSGDVMGNEELMNQHGFEKPHSLVPHAENHHSSDLR